jgi:hypothetical protein
MTTNNFNLDSNLFNQNINNLTKYIVEVEKEINPETYFIYSYIPNFKEKYVNREIDTLKNFIHQSADSPEDVPQIIKPTVVDINYNIEDLNLKNNFSENIKFYDDGIILTSHHKVKCLFDISVSRRSGDFLKIDKDNPDYTCAFELISVNGKCIYFSADEVETLYQKRKHLKFYIVCPQFSKTKALCLEFKNNKYFIELLEYIRSKYKAYFDDLATHVSFSFFKEMPGEYVEDVYLESIGMSKSLYTAQDYIKRQGADEDDYLKLKSVTGRTVFPTKKELLLMGFNQLVMQNLMSLSGYMISFQKSKNKDKLLKSLKKKNPVAYEIFKDFEKFKTVREVCKAIVDSTFNKRLNEETVLIIKKSLMKASTRAMDDNHLHDHKVVIAFYYLWFLLSMTKKGTYLPFVGPIDYHRMSDETASLYWPSMNHTLLVSGWMEQVNSFKYMNTLNFVKDYPEFSDDLHYTSLKHAREKIETLEGEPLEFVNKVIEEIENTGTGEYIPYNAAYEIKDDPQFKYVRFIENERLIMFFVTDYNEEVLVDVYNKLKKKFGYWILNTQKLSEEQLRSSS